MSKREVVREVDLHGHGSRILFSRANEPGYPIDVLRLCRCHPSIAISGTRQRDNHFLLVRAEALSIRPTTYNIIQVPMVLGVISCTRSCDTGHTRRVLRTRFLDHPVRLRPALLMLYPARNHVGVGAKDFLLALCLPAKVGAAQ
jgi:hypothetical protein